MATEAGYVGCEPARTIDDSAMRKHSPAGSIPAPLTNLEDRKEKPYLTEQMMTWDATEKQAEVIPANRCANRDQNMAGEWFRCIHPKGHKGNHLPSAFAEEY